MVELPFVHLRSNLKVVLQLSTYFHMFSFTPVRQYSSVN